MNALTDAEDAPPHEFFLRPPWPGAEMQRDEDTPPAPFRLPLSLDEISTPVPPQDLTSLVGELLTLAEVWRRIETDDRVPEDVRSVYHRCAESITRIIAEHRQTDVSELAPESTR